MPAWSTAVAIVASVVGGAAILWPALVELEVRKCERPKYALLRRLPRSGAEIRRYAPLLLAERAVDAPDMKAAGGQGFRALAGFIFGKNERKEEAGGAGKKSEAVAMTSPVVMSGIKEGGGAQAADAPTSNTTAAKETIKMTSPVIMAVKDKEGSTSAATTTGAVRATMAFTMPSKYTLDTLPTPLDPSVRVREQPARTVAALQFRGQVRSKAAYQAPAAKLRAALEQEAAVRIKGPLEVYQYYPPFTWGFLRVNEVAYEVEEVEGEGVAAAS
jgi:hypothetical protein